jgi:CubicO group peptidase (beta-lactamase class C family)
MIVSTMLGLTALAVQDPRFAAVARFADSAAGMTGPRSLAISIAVVKDGALLWEAGFGSADPGRGRAASPRTVYPLASVAKSITAVATLRLVASGRLRLDTPVALPGAPPAERPTVRQLLSMTGGIPHLVRFSYADEPGGPAGISVLLRRHGGPAFPPGRFFHYANLSFGALQYLLERTTGKPFARVLEAEVFRPLGLDGTSVRATGPHAAMRARALVDRDQPPLPVTILEPEGGAGLYGTVHDLALLGGALVDRARPERLLTRRVVDTMLAVPPGSVYGLGWWTGITQGPVPVRLADGSALGTASTLAIVPDSGLAVAVLANAPNVADLVHEIVSRLLAVEVPANAGAPPIQPPPALAEQPFHGDPGWQGRWRGLLRGHPAGPKIALAVSDSTITVAIGRDRPVRLDNVVLSGQGLLTAESQAALPKTLTQGLANTLSFTLSLVDGKIRGYLSAASTGGRPRFVLPYPLELVREDVKGHRMGISKRLESSGR